MDPGRSYPSSSLEDQLRNMITGNGNNMPPYQPSPQYQIPQPSAYAHMPPPPPGFESIRHQQQIPAGREQGFNQFLQHHHVNMPAPHRPATQGYMNDMRHQGPHRHPRQMDPNNFQRPRPTNDPRHVPSNYQNRHLYQPNSQPQPQMRPSHPPGIMSERQWQYLAAVADCEIPRVQMPQHEIDLKDSFRVKLQQLFENLTSPDPEKPLPSVILQSFGSLSSGFATSGSDMDLAIVTPAENQIHEHFSSHENSLPRVLEKELLDRGYGARLLTRTRVPIIKICEEPSDELLQALRGARAEWDNLPECDKYASSKAPADDTPPKGDVANTRSSDAQSPDQLNGSGNENNPSAGSDQTANSTQADGISSLVKSTEALHVSLKNPNNTEQSTAPDQEQSTNANGKLPHEKQANRQRNDRGWRRERAAGPLDFPKQGVGIQCDINFFNPLGIHNTRMLRCYSKCDPRVRPMVLFVKAWAKRRKINSSYSGTLSSYGFVLMVLHYLVNVANPPVLPNLQLQAAANNLPSTEIDGFEVRFFGDEETIEHRARQGLLTQNHEPLGMLLCGFFQYYAQTRNGYGFIWTQEVLSLRTAGGILTKQEKGWTGAKTEVGENKEVRHRYLFAIEDPFEVSHNVARTVTHNGICAIRDEFRRAWRILTSVGRDMTPHDGELFAEMQELEEKPLAPPPRAPPSADMKPRDYGQQFPTLGAQTSSVVEKAVSPPAVQASQPVMPPLSTPVQPPQEPAPAQVPAVARGKGRRQRFVPLNMEASGEISGDRARVHLEQYRRGQNGVPGRPTF